MTQGRIQRIVCHRLQERADVRLPTAWISGNTAEPTWTDGTWLTRKQGFAAPADGSGPVLVFLRNGSEDARTALLGCAAAGARVYALVGPGWADSQVLQAPRVLVRRLAEVPASAVHAGVEARLWLGGGFVLRLAPTQAEALRQTFLRLFWHEATEEAYSGGPHFVWRSAGERPFDVPAVPTSASVRWEPAEARLSGDPRCTMMHLSAGLPPERAPRRLWFPVGPDHHDRLSKLVQAGAEVLWADRGLPDIQVHGDGGEVLLPGTRGRLRLRLTNQQAPEVARLLEATSAWQFHANLRLGEAKHRAAQFWLPGEPAARGLEAEQIVEVPEVPAASLRDVSATEPASVPAAQPLALAVHYRWTVVPPHVPMGASEDPLVGRWRKLDEEWTARHAKVREALVTADGERERIGRDFSRLTSALLGFQRTHDQLVAGMGALEAQRPSAAGPSGALELLTQLGELEDAARKLQADLEAAERKAGEDEQQAEWQRSVDDAKRKLPDCRRELEMAESRLADITEELRDIEQSLHAAGGEAKKDLSANQRKLSDERKQCSKKVTRLGNDVVALEQQAVKLFVFRPPRAPMGRPVQPGGRFVPSASSPRPAANVPEEALPEVGLLRRHKGERYLVLETWEQLATGEQTAARLHAKLVAPENA